MSRCFPFPPPGYEKKIQAEEADLLIKEKQKEKKHKKDKNREKKEGKEKKSKNRSTDKHKERKEKHKDRKDKEKDKALGEKVLPNTAHREKLVTNTVQINSDGELKYVQDLARRIRYEEEATGSQTAQKTKYLTQRNSRMTEKTFENSSFYPIQETGRRYVDDKRINTQKNISTAKSSENAGAQKKVEAMGKSPESIDQARQKKSPEKSHCRESATKCDKSGDKEGLKKIEAKDKDANREKKDKKTESINTTRQEKPKLIRVPRLLEREKDSLDIRNCKPPSDLSRASVKNLIAEGNLGKRKDLETYGLLYENGTTPNKLQRQSASVPSVENVRTLGAQRTPPMSASEVQGTMGKPKVNEVRINGFIISGQKLNVCPPSPLASTMKVKVKENGEASANPPHPDSKYLNQIFNVPKKELLVDVDDDQEWLFGAVGVKFKKARTDSPDLGESLQVWNQAFRIESADIVALPYVVPF